MDERSVAGFAALGAGFVLVAFVLSLFYIICSWRIYTKAGQPGWAVLIPIYNLIVYFRIIRRPGWWILLYLLPMVVSFTIIASLAVAIENGTTEGLSIAAGVGLLFSLVMLALFIISIIDTHRLSLSFGKDAGFTVGLILLGFIFIPILAFSDARYTWGKQEVRDNSPLDQNL